MNSSSVPHPTVLEWIFFLPSSIWCLFSNNGLGKQQSNTGSYSLEKENCHSYLFLSSGPSTARSWWEVRDCQPTAFKSSQSCEKNTLREATTGWKGWGERVQESLGDREGVTVDTGVLCFLRAEYRLTGFLEVKVKTGRRFLPALTRNMVCSTGNHPVQGQVGVGALSKVLSHSIWFYSWSHARGRGYCLKGWCPASTVRHHCAYSGYLWR